MAQYVKFLLEYTGTEYNDKIYNFGPAPDYDRSEWLNEKFNLGLDFPNLPYYIDGNIKITQSNAIMRYIGTKNNLAGKTEEERVQVSMLECEAYDLRMAFGKLCYDPNFEKLKGAYLSETLPNKLKLLSTFLGDRKYFVGDDVSIRRLFLYEVLDINQILCPTCLDSFENLKKFKTTIESLPPKKIHGI
ncbi:UNVERIFIED_CONTAM: hypothetical protein GTU68_012213 [Idotea baltica]|nr:hypothetical protein [Idotea baltica]